MPSTTKNMKIASPRPIFDSAVIHHTIIQHQFSDCNCDNHDGDDDADADGDDDDADHEERTMENESVSDDDVASKICIALHDDYEHANGGIECGAHAKARENESVIESASEIANDYDRAMMMMMMMMLLLLLLLLLRMLRTKEARCSFFPIAAPFF